ncbi:DMT family transporter [Agromyces sp. NPDC058064]|uniref:DMT family transporter n=1 Tax=Agromyces sp. NPDC058064 TaxID=3346322 RepID=UPI0036D9FA40
MVLLSSTWVIVGTALDGAGAGAVSAGRTVFSSFGLLALVLMSRKRQTTPSASRGVPDRPRRYTAWQLLVLAGTGVAGYTMLSTVAINLAGPMLPSLVLSLSPALVLVLEAATTRIRLNVRTLIATCGAVGGAVLYIVPRFNGAADANLAVGVLAACGAILSMAVYSIYFAHVHRHFEGALAPRILPIFALGSIPLMVWAWLDVAAGQKVEPSSIAMLAFLGVAVYVPAYLLQHRLLINAGAAFTSLLGLAVPPLVGVASAALGTAAAPGGLQIAGIGITLAGMVLVIRASFTGSPIENELR